MSVSEGHVSVLFIALCSAVTIFIGSLVHTVIYNLYRHPLSKVPGPKLAGATYLYQTWFSRSDKSRYYIQIAKLHEQYGTVRSAPYLPHCAYPFKARFYASLPTKSTSLILTIMRLSILLVPNMPSLRHSTMDLVLGTRRLVLARTTCTVSGGES